MSEESTREAVRLFTAAFRLRDPALLDAVLAPDCVVENDDGLRYRGRAAPGALWSGISRRRDAVFEPEQVWTSENRAVVTWRVHWGPSAAESVHGVNVMRLRDGLIVEALGYVRN